MVIARGAPPEAISREVPVYLYPINFVKLLNTIGMPKAKIFICIFVALLATVLLKWKLREKSPETALRPLMGTLVAVTVSEEDQEQALKLIDSAFREIQRIEEKMSFHSDKSELWLINLKAQDGPVPVSEELLYVVTESQKAAQLTNGAFDITVGSLGRLWGFSPQWSHHSERNAEVVPPKVPAPHEIDKALTSVGYENIHIEGNSISITAGAQIDLSAVAKGYAVDKALSVLEQSGVQGALIEAGGDIGFFGVKPDGSKWRVYVQHPRDPDTLIGVYGVNLECVATSGDYEKFFEQDGKRYHHILDPKTGYPSDRSVSATVWAESALEADILSTAAFVMGPQRGIELIEDIEKAEALIFFIKDRKLQYRHTDGLSGKLDFGVR